jgi:hypothetical protein
MNKPAAVNRVSIGSLVTNLKMQDWGPGKILELSSTAGTVHFRDLPTGSQVRKIGLSYLAFSAEQSDPTLDLIALPKAKGAVKRKRPSPKKKAVAARVVEAVAEAPEETSEATTE